MEFRRTVCNALMKSSLTSACHCVDESRKARVAWTIASAPPDIPTHSCLGANEAPETAGTGESLGTPILDYSQP